MKVYSISSNLYSNSCQSDNPEELAKYIADVLKKSPNKTTFVITVSEMPQELWDSNPLFDGFKMKSEVNNDQSD